MQAESDDVALPRKFNSPQSVVPGSAPNYSSLSISFDAVSKYEMSIRQSITASQCMPQEKLKPGMHWYGRPGEQWETQRVFELLHPRE
jgi:hypothetical protein